LTLKEELNKYLHKKRMTELHFAVNYSSTCSSPTYKLLVRTWLVCTGF